MGIFVVTANVDYHLSFANQGKQTSVFHLKNTNRSCSFPLVLFSVYTGVAVNCGLKRFFSMYRPSYLIEAYVRPEKYWLVWAGPLAKHLNNFYFIFLSDDITAARAA
jgi:hypothetical protein